MVQTVEWVLFLNVWASIMSSVFVLFVHFPLHPCSPVPVPTVLQMSSCQYALNFRVGHDLSTKQQQPSLRVTIYTPRLASLAQPHLHGRHPCWCIFFSIIPPHCWCKFPSREPIQCIYPSHQGWTEGWIKNQLPFPRSRVVSFFFFILIQIYLSFDLNVNFIPPYTQKPSQKHPE